MELSPHRSLPKSSDLLTHSIIKIHSCKNELRKCNSPQKRGGSERWKCHRKEWNIRATVPACTQKIRVELPSGETVNGRLEIIHTVSGIFLCPGVGRKRARYLLEHRAPSFSFFFITRLLPLRRGKWRMQARIPRTKFHRGTRGRRSVDVIDRRKRDGEKIEKVGSMHLHQWMYGLETSIRLDSISRPARPQSPSPIPDEWQSNRGFEICAAVLHDSGPGPV